MPNLPDAAQVFGAEAPEARVYEHVIGLLRTLGGHFHSVSLSSVADALGWANDLERKKAIVRALDQLAFGKEPILERQFLLWPADENSDEVLAGPECRVSELEMRRALLENALVVEKTGEVVPDFLDRVTVEYIVTDAARTLEFNPVRS